MKIVLLYSLLFLGLTIPHLLKAGTEAIAALPSCSICFDEIREEDQAFYSSYNPQTRVIANCHTFHTACIQQIHEHGLRACPICRRREITLPTSRSAEKKQIAKIRNRNQAMINAITNSDQRGVAEITQLPGFDPAYEFDYLGTRSSFLILAASVSRTSDLLLDLVTAGCDIEHQNDAGITPLIAASRANRRQNIGLLLALGARPNYGQHTAERAEESFCKLFSKRLVITVGSVGLGVIGAGIFLL
jgi:hypothetical protein